MSIGKGADFAPTIQPCKVGWKRHRVNGRKRIAHAVSRCRARPSSDQLFPAKAEVDAASDNNVVMQRNAKRFRGGLDRARHIDVRP